MTEEDSEDSEEVKEARRQALEMFKDYKNLILISSDEDRDPVIGTIVIGGMEGTMNTLNRVLSSNHPLSKMFWNVIRSLLEEGVVTFKDDGIIINSPVKTNNEFISNKKKGDVPLLHYGEPGEA